MDLPKCRTCGERHRLGGCPGNATKTSRGAGSSVDPSSTPSGLQHGAATNSNPSTADHLPRGKGKGAVNVAKPQLAPRGTKPAKKAKPKKEKKNAKASSRSKPKKPSQPATTAKAKPKPKVDARQDLPASAGDVAQLAAGQIKVGPPRKGEEHKTLTATKPWEKLKPPCSRASYYRKIKQGKIVP